jgi:hypothetical protein
MTLLVSILRAMTFLFFNFFNCPATLRLVRWRPCYSGSVDGGGAGGGARDWGKVGEKRGGALGEGEGFQWLSPGEALRLCDASQSGGGEGVDGGTGMNSSGGDSIRSSSKSGSMTRGGGGVGEGIPHAGDVIWFGGLLGEDMGDVTSVEGGGGRRVEGGLRGDVCEEYGYRVREVPLRLFDSFSFFQELDMLELRLHELDAAVHRYANDIRSLLAMS